ncbi:Hsp70 family protein [Phaeosphaeria sp. MPI-PUGE-AT-0046c]|nr:Hsp70 family protein [Phaeosphaeria sp. MPI-PUGE-AT-0046c]
MKRNRLVIGLDYGTTYTGKCVRKPGVSYCETSDTGLDEKSIKVVNNWPSRHTKIGTKEKVPSEIAYPLEGTQWGSLIPPNVPRYMWTKLELDRPQTGEAAEVLKEQQVSARNLDKRPVDIIADFLRYVKDHLLNTLDEAYRREVWSTLPITLVVTVPAVWSDAAKDRTLQAVRQAGFDNRCLPSLSNTLLATEPEAAAIYTLKSLRGTTQDHQLAVGDGFIVCDMGGGTVDLISYRVAELRPTVVEEATIGTGHQCGGSFIDRAFLKWLEDRIGAAHFLKIAECRSEDLPRTLITSKLGRMVQDFTLEVKTGFSGNETNFLRLPPPLCAIEDDTARGISDGEILITPADMIEMFEFPVRQTCDLIDGQIKQARKANKANPKFVFLVGGFSESPYMYNKIKEFVEAKGLKTIRPAYAWSAVVRGAAARALEGDGRPPIRNRKCRRHYGTACTRPFISGTHREADSFICPFSGLKRADKQLSWHLMKGQDLSTSKLPHASLSMFISFWPHEKRIVKLSLWATDMDRVPNRRNNVSCALLLDVYEVAQLCVDLTNVPNHKFKVRQNSASQAYHEVDFQVEFSATSSLEYAVSVGGTRYGSVSARYA